MRFIHIADLHIGKRVNEYSMLEDQKYILTKIINIIDEKKVEAVLIAGDVYDKTVPSDEAVRVLDDFLTRLSKRKLQVFVISGNHDSVSRLSFGSKLMELSGIHISQTFNGVIDPVVLEDKHGKLNVYLLPFIKPVHVREAYEEADATKIHDYTEAMSYVIGKMNIDTQDRNILLCHQFVTGAKRSESEDIVVGGLDNVDARVFDPFDYVALGHIHKPQHIQRDTVRYSGTPLKYSVSEALDEKSVTIVDMDEKGSVHIQTELLIPKRDLRRIRGEFNVITDKSFYSFDNKEDYIDITLTDEEEIPEAINKLRIVYPNLLSMHYDNQRTRKNNVIESIEEADKKSPLELFSELFKMQNNRELNEDEVNLLNALVCDIWGEEV